MGDLNCNHENVEHGKCQMCGREVIVTLYDQPKQTNTRATDTENTRLRALLARAREDLSQCVINLHGSGYYLEQYKQTIKDIDAELKVK